MGVWVGVHEREREGRERGEREREREREREMERVGRGRDIIFLSYFTQCQQRNSLSEREQSVFHLIKGTCNMVRWNNMIPQENNRQTTVPESRQLRNEKNCKWKSLEHNNGHIIR